MALPCSETKTSRPRRISSSGTSSAASHGCGSKDSAKGPLSELLEGYSTKVCCLCGFGADESSWKKGALLTLSSGRCAKCIVLVKISLANQTLLLEGLADNVG